MRSTERLPHSTVTGASAPKLQSVGSDLRHRVAIFNWLRTCQVGRDRLDRTGMCNRLARYSPGTFQRCGE
jgi:hypothetical protein